MLILAKLKMIPLGEGAVEESKRTRKWELVVI